ncbi:MAG: hypothetical protein OEY66_09345 [Gammaproteobacteria bacterium]|nr:hypothetical protein [Gammaproteobacteria bacterium]
MIKYRLIFSSVFLIALGILIWRISLLFTNLTNMLPEVEIESGLDTKATSHEDTISVNESFQPTNNSTNNNKPDHYDYGTITGDTTDTPEKESAMTQIDEGATDITQNQNIDDGEVDIPINIDTQPIENFIVTDITQNQNIDDGNVDISTNAPPPITDNSMSSYYETTEKIIARIKQEAILTKTTTDTPGGESAMIQIGAGSADMSFNKNSQLMEGFIIIEIFENEIFLQHPVSYVTFSIKVQSRNE